MKIQFIRAITSLEYGSLQFGHLAKGQFHGNLLDTDHRGPCLPPEPIWLGILEEAHHPQSWAAERLKTNGSSNIFLTSQQASHITREIQSSALMLKFFKFKQFSYIMTGKEEFQNDTKNLKLTQFHNNIVVEKEGPRVPLLFHSFGHYPLNITQGVRTASLGERKTRSPCPRSSQSRIVNLSEINYSENPMKVVNA